MIVDQEEGGDERSVLVDEIDEGIVRLLLNRPRKLNAFDHEMVADLHDALRRIASDRSCRVVVLTGAGRGFCAGLDLEGEGVPPAAGDVGSAALRLTGQGHIADLVPRMRDLRQPIVAAVNGPAVGGGFALALASDVRVAGDAARFSAAFVRVGYSGCDIGVSWLLPRLVGASRAFEMMLTGRIIDADEADRIGLLSVRTEEADPLPAALDIARSIRSNSPFGIWMTKEVMWSNLEVGSLRAGLDLENRTQILTTFTADTDEARAAFVQGREPRFQYR